jgi:hypothetical protein
MDIHDLRLDPLAIGVGACGEGPSEGKDLDGGLSNAEELRRLPWNARRDLFERRVRARQQIGDLSHLDVTPMRHRRAANAARTSSEKSCGSSQAAKWPPLSTPLK